MALNRRYTIISQAPPDEDGNPGMAIGIDLRMFLSFFEDGWQKIFEERYGRPFDVEKDIADKISDYPKGFEWMNNLPISQEKLFGKRTEIWQPNKSIPVWVEKNYGYIILAQKILKQGKNISEMHWRDFEKLIGDLLEFEGWDVDVTRSSKDGGVDVIAIKKDPTLGLIKTVWQAKKYGTNSLVQVKDVRELSALIDNFNATKGIVVTTNNLTKGAIDWIKKDIYRIDYKDRNQLNDWITKSSLF
jgi:hypothetical protein